MGVVCMVERMAQTTMVKAKLKSHVNDDVERVQEELGHSNKAQTIRYLVEAGLVEYERAGNSDE